MQNFFIEFLPPWVETGLQPAFYDKESGTVLQQVSRMYAKINELIKNNNTLTTEFNELYNYVHNYFDNLDVQEEINNKLEEMAEQGELATIIAEFLQLGTIFTFDTVADMIVAENLVDGCSCQTLGNVTLNDGYGAIYKIGTTGDIALDNGLYATLKDNTQDGNYYSEITITKGRANDTDYRYATIPLNDTDGNLIPCYVNEDNTETYSPLNYADKEFTTITMNAGLGRLDSNDQWKQGAVIANGVALHGDLCDIAPTSKYGYIGIKADRTVLSFPATTTTDQMLAAGVQNAFLCWGTIVTSGAVDIDAEVDPTQINPWMHLGVKADGTIIIFSSDGRTDHDPGMTLLESANLMVSLGCATVFRIDAGGSSSLVYKGSKQNRNIDNKGTTERGIWVTLNFKKTTTNKQLAEAFSFIGKERQLMNRQIREDLVSSYETKRAFTTIFAVATGINKITTADTWQNLELADSLSHNRGDNYELIKNLDNRIIGVRFNTLGIYEIDINCLIVCANTAGDRGLRVDSPLGTAITSHASSTSRYVPNDTSTNFEKNLLTCFNITTAGTEVYFCGKGQVNDDFNRINLTIRQIGFAN